MKTYCVRCGKSGHVYPVRYTEPMKNQCYAVDLCFKCAHEYHKVMVDWCKGHARNKCKLLEEGWE